MGFDRLGVRARTTAITTIALGLVLSVAGLWLISTLRSRIELIIIDSAEERAVALASSLAGMETPSQLSLDSPELFAQVVDHRGTVLASDRFLEGLGATLPSEATDGAGVLRTQALVADGPIELRSEGPYVVVARTTDLASGPAFVLVGASLEDAEEAARAALPVTIAGIPILLILAGAITWVLTGRALSPVEKMRRAAAQLSALDLSQRLPLPRAKDEIRNLAQTLNEMLEHLELSSRKQRQFVSDASHELKSPLTSLRTMVDVGEQAHPELQMLFDDLRAELIRMERLASDLLFLARSDERSPDVLIAPVDLAELAPSVTTFLVAGTVDLSGLRTAWVDGDRDRLGQLVRNLVDNASLYGRAGLWLESYTNDSDAFLLVSDDGAGIAEADRERVFERFVRLDESRGRHSGGAGLGLAVARAIARKHGGDVRVIDARHGGATFEVRLPKTGSVTAAPS